MSTPGSSPRASWLRSLAFTGTLVLLLSGAGRVLDGVSRRDDTRKLNWLFRQHGGRYSLAVIGSSRGYVTTDASTLARITGGRTINLSLDGASYPELALVIDRFLRDNRVDRLLVEVDLFGLDSTALTYPFHEYQYLPYLADPIVERHLRRAYGPRELAWKYIPFLRHAEFNDEIGVGALYRRLRHERAEYDTTGSFLIDRDYFDPSIAGMKPTRYAISAKRERGLRDILETARRHGVQPALYIAPEYRVLQPLVLNRDSLLAHYRSIAAEYGIPIWEFQDGDLSNDSTFFKDAEHLNRRGAERFSEMLGRVASNWSAGPRVPTSQ